MSAFPSLVEPNTLKRLNQTMIGLAVVVLLASGFWGTKLFIAKAQLASAKGSEKTIQGQILEAKKSVEDAKKASVPNRPTGIAAASHFQSKIEEAASAKHVLLSEFTVSPSLMPYATTYASTTTEQGWSQLSIKMSLSGTLGNILSLLRTLNDQGELLELDSVTFAREKLDDNGNAVVSAKLDVRLLVKAEAA